MTFASKPIYLDNNATTALDPLVLEEMRPYLLELAGNPSSQHSIGRRARQAIDVAKRRIAGALGAEPEEIYFTSGATESNNLAILGTPSRSDDCHVLVSPSEHPSALEPCLRLARRGLRVEELTLDSEGHGVSLRDRLCEQTRLVVVQLANSETGCIQDIRSMTDQLPAGCRFHCDAVQAVGKIPVSFHDLGATTLSISGHKIHGPTGIGALLVRKNTRLEPIWFGGHQQGAIRPGTEAVAAIVGLGKAVELASRDLEENARRMARLRDRFEELVMAGVSDVVRNGPLEGRLPNTANLSLLGAKAEALLIAMDLAGVCCSAGTACASGSLEPSKVLSVMGITGDRLNSALRFSVSRFTTEEEIERAAERLGKAIERVRRTVRAK